MIVYYYAEPQTDHADPTKHMPLLESSMDLVVKLWSLRAKRIVPKILAGWDRLR